MKDLDQYLTAEPVQDCEVGLVEYDSTICNTCEYQEDCEIYGYREEN